MWACVASILVVVILLHWIIVWRRAAADGIPGPVPLPLLGNSIRAFRNRTQLHKLLSDEKYRKYGPIVRVWLVGMMPVFFLNSPEAIQQILVKHQPRYDRSTLEQRSLSRMLQGGLLMQNNGALWKASRQILGKAFHRSSLKSMIPLFELRAKILVDSLHERLEKRPNERCDMQTEFQKLTFDVIGLVSMGIDFGSQTEEANPYERAWEVVLNQLMFRFYFPLPKFVWDWLWFVSAVQEFRDSIGLLETAIQDAIDLRKKAIQIEGVAEDASDLLSLMLRQQQECPADDATLYGDKKIQRELLTFMFAGHDTTRSTLCWLLYYISKDKDVEKRVLEEIQRVFPDGANGQLLFDNLSQLKYLRCVMQETLRLHPPAPVRGRTLNEDDTILGYKLPKGSHVTWSPYSLQRIADIWENPLEFDASRWEGDAPNQIPAGAYVPFGAGVRRCIGEQMALNEMLSVIVVLLQSFTFTVANDTVIEDEWALTLSMTNGLPMYIHPR